MTVIEFKDVSKLYPTGQLALSKVDLKIHSGEMAFITGPSGAGKSTLLKLIALLETPSHGEIWVGNRLMSTLPSKQLPNYRRRIGFIFQNPHLLSERTVFGNVALPLEISGLPKDIVVRRVEAALNRMDLSPKRDALPDTLSAGEKQRVGIARAVVNKPNIILADEPTGNLDPGLAEDIMYTFNQFNQLGVTVLIASHDMHLIERMQKRIIKLRKASS